MQGKDKIDQLKASIQARKEAEAKKEEAIDKDLSFGMEQKYQEKVLELESSLEHALQKTEELQVKASESHDQFLRQHAELENFRKRMEREKTELAKYGHEKVIQELLPVIDSLDKALEHADEAHDYQDLLDGVHLVLKQFLQSLEKFGVISIKAHGKPFDPNIHEAVGHQESGEHPSDHVMQEHRRGFKIHDRVLRPSMVSVSKGQKKKEEK